MASQQAQLFTSATFYLPLTTPKGYTATLSLRFTGTKIPPPAPQAGKLNERLMNNTALSRRIFPAFFLALWIGACAVALAQNASAQSGGWLTHSHDEQHTALSTVQSQSLDAIHWHVPVDLHPPQGEIFIHYGSPLITAANTVI